jgi:hypothetical protein
MTLQEDKFIEQFLKGELNIKEKDFFLKKMESDDDFRKRVSFEQELFDRLGNNDLNFVKKTTNDELTFYENKIQQSTTKNIQKHISEASKSYHTKQKNKINLTKILSVAASITLLFSIFFFNNSKKNTTKELYNFYFSTEDIPSLVDRTSNTKIANAEILFLKKDYKKAFQIFNESLQSSDTQTHSSIYLYLSICQIKENLFDDAETTLNQLISSDLIDSEKGYWYKGMLYLKTNSIEKLKNVLKLIIAEKYFNYKKAEELLNKLI